MVPNKNPESAEVREQMSSSSSAQRKLTDLQLQPWPPHKACPHTHGAVGGGQAGAVVVLPPQSPQVLKKLTFGFLSCLMVNSLWTKRALGKHQLQLEEAVMTFKHMFTHLYHVPTRNRNKMLMNKSKYPKTFSEQFSLKRLKSENI